MAEEEVKDFTNRDKRPAISFTIDDDTFVAVGNPPANAFLDVATVNKAEGLDKVLIPASAERFAERLGSAEVPIELDQAASIAVWLMEEKYAEERPTEAPSPSSNGSGSTGPSSTGGAPAEASTPLL